ncbi:enoyl-CoA hydratase/isomerase family protein [Actinomadura vinacea]|uniref:Enoyl-CoA hydratase/isomerase family protein n=1 Tax=Actinomadura vinacea TaxID=115336 RepID=A0ABN3IR39_9ACTN
MNATSPTATDDRIVVIERDDVAVIRIDRPTKLNALTRGMRLALTSAVRAYGDGTRAKGIVVTGAGRAFSAGKDLSEGFEGSFQDSLDDFNDMTRAILATKVPTIAAINGIAVGGAAEFTLCFDARVGAPTAEFYFPENMLGLPISNASSLLLPRLVGPAQANRLLLESPRTDASRALALGLLDDVHEPGDLVDEAVERARRWSSPGANGLMLSLLRPVPDAVEAAMDRESRVAAAIWSELKQST